MIERMWPHVRSCGRAHGLPARPAPHPGVARDRQQAQFYGLAAALDQPRGLRRTRALLLGRLLRATAATWMRPTWRSVLGRTGIANAMSASRDAFAYDLAASVTAAMKRARRSTTSPAARSWETSTPPRPRWHSPRPAPRSCSRRPRSVPRSSATGSSLPTGATARSGGRPSRPTRVRTIGSFVRLGWRDRANQALEWFMKYRNRRGWRQWAEVAYRQPRAPQYRRGHAAHLGGYRTSCARCSTCWPTSADATARWSWARVPWKWLGAGSPVEVRSVQTLYGPMRFADAGPWRHGRDFDRRRPAHSGRRHHRRCRRRTGTFRPRDRERRGRHSCHHRRRGRGLGRCRRRWC